MLIKMVTSASTLEGYKKQIKKRDMLFVMICVLGMIMTIGGITAYSSGLIEDDHASGFITGAGSGLILAGIVFLVRNRQIQKNEKLLKEEWIKETDERNHEVMIKALSLTAEISFILIYIVLIISFFINRKVFIALSLAVLTVLIIFISCRRYYEKTM